MHLVVCDWLPVHINGGNNVFFLKEQTASTQVLQDQGSGIERRFMID